MKMAWLGSKTWYKCWVMWLVTDTTTRPATDSMPSSRCCQSGAIVIKCGMHYLLLCLRYFFQSFSKAKPPRTLLLLLCVMLGVVGCQSSSVVFVEESDGLVRLGPDVRGKVYYWDGEGWSLSSSVVRLPEGWYAGSLNGSQDETWPDASDN